MEEEVSRCSTDPTVRELAVNLMAGVENNDLTEQINRVVHFVMSNVTYVRDPVDGEYLVSPLKLIADYYQQGFAIGDCDDHVMLLNSLLGSIGFQTKAVGVKFGGSPDFNHVISGVILNGQLIQIDPCAKSGPQPQYNPILTI